MNKIFTKVAGVALGLSLAIGVGVGVGSKTALQRADAGEALVYTLDGTTTGGSSGYDTESSITQSGVSWKATGNTTMNPWRIGGKSLSEVDRPIYSTTPINQTITKVDLETGTASSVTVNSLNLIVASDSGFSNVIETVSKTFSASSVLTFSPTKEWKNCYYKFVFNITISVTSNKFLQFVNAKFYITTAADPTVSSVDVSAESIVGTYKTDSYIQCNAVVNGDNNPSQDVIWTLSSNTTYVPEQTSASGATIDQNGKVVFNQDASVYAFATSTVTGYTNVRGYVKCTASGLLDPISYVKVDKSSRLTVGTKVVILNADGTYALSTTQNSSNRAAVEISVDTSGDNPVAAVIPTKVQVFELVAGVESGFNFSLDDNGTTKYLYANGQNSNNYLKTGTSRYANSTDFNINVVNGECTISLVQTTYNGVMRYNNTNKAFSCYATSSSVNPVSIYMLGSDLPEDVPLTSISNVSNADVEVGSSVTVTASYLPANATESISVTPSGSGEVEIGPVSMNAGTASFTVTGVSVGDVTLTLSGQNGSVSTTKSLSVTQYVATHNRIEDTDHLFNGERVILGGLESEKMYVGSHHTGGNNIPSVEVAYGNEGASIAVGSTNYCEYTIWNMTIDDITGWAFYADGYYLTSSTGNNNYLKRSEKLTNLCLFNIGFESGAAVIVASNSEVERNTIRLNSSTHALSCYSSGQSDIFLYTANSTSSDANIVAGYEDFFLHMDAIDESDKGTGKCTSNGLYDNAKEVFNNTLTPAQRNALSEGARARLAAWAEANGDEIDSGTGLLVEKANSGFEFSGDNNSMTIITIIAIASLMSFAALIVLKKKKLNK